MATHNWKLRLATMLLCLGCIGTVQADERDPVPAILVDPVDPAATPEPICGLCAIVVKPPAGSSLATVTVTHDRDFAGDVELVVWLDSDERATVWIPAVAVEGGDQLEIEVEAGEGWSWDEVQFAWTRLHPTL